MTTQQEKLKQILLEGGFIETEEFEKIEKEAQSSAKSFEQVIVEKNILTDEQIGRLIAQVNNWEYIALKKEPIDRQIMMAIPKEMAQKKKVLAFAQTSKGVKVAMNNPEDMTLRHLLEKKIGKIRPYYATAQDISDQLKLYKSNVIDELEKVLAAQVQGGNKHDAHAQNKQSTPVEVLNILLEHGYDSGASDIHIEPREKNTVVRYRIDGVMQNIAILPKDVHELVISRIKVMADLHTDEHQTPQDGKFEFIVEGRKFDVRVSIVPTTKGENAVMRILGEKSTQLTLEELGLAQKSLQLLQQAITKPWGMILTTGPTGSGKTTSLYSILKILHQQEVHIATIEDPVEYNIDGITQIQVNPKAKLTFASGLRSIVRQDPDIIMVGEIRDQETADIAVNSAMTGHLVLSSLHANDAATTIPRMLDLDVDPFLIASTINIVIAQRLLRKICVKCIRSSEPSIEELSEKFPIAFLEKLARGRDKITVYEGVGCGLCSNTGYHGRTGAFEIMEIDDAIRKLIMANADTDEMRRKAIENGMITMFEDAKEKVLNGITTLDEVMRVIKQ